MVTRSPERAACLVRLLEGLGAEVWPCQVTSIAAVEDAGLRTSLSRLREGAYDWVLFGSANAVRRFFEELGRAGLTSAALAAVQVGCVGPATDTALRARGLRAVVVPHQSDAVGLGHAVMAAAGTTVRSARILVPGAAGGRTEAVEALRAAGAEVDVVALYRSQTVAADAPEAAKGLSLLRARDVDVVAFYAPSQVRATCELLGAEAAELIRACRVVAAIGGTTRAALEERGVTTIAVPSSPTPEALASAIVAEYAGPLLTNPETR